VSISPDIQYNLVTLDISGAHPCGHFRAHWVVCQSGSWWDFVHRLDWDAGAAWTWVKRGRGERTGPPSIHKVVSLIFA